jgi:hypothetical protein
VSQNRSSDGGGHSAASTANVATTSDLGSYWKSLGPSTIPENSGAVVSIK